MIHEDAPPQEAIQSSRASVAEMMHAEKLGVAKRVARIALATTHKIADLRRDRSRQGGENDGCKERRPEAGCSNPTVRHNEASFSVLTTSSGLVDAGTHTSDKTMSPPSRPRAIIPVCVQAPRRHRDCDHRKSLPRTLVDCSCYAASTPFSQDVTAQRDGLIWGSRRASPGFHF